MLTLKVIIFLIYLILYNIYNSYVLFFKIKNYNGDRDIVTTDMDERSWIHCIILNKVSGFMKTTIEVVISKNFNFGQFRAICRSYFGRTKVFCNCYVMRHQIEHILVEKDL